MACVGAAAYYNYEHDQTSPAVCDIFIAYLIIIDLPIAERHSSINKDGVQTTSVSRGEEAEERFLWRCWSARRESPSTLIHRKANKTTANTIQFIRDQFTITTWLALGALLQSLLFLLLGRPALIPATTYILLSLANTAATTLGWKPNPLMTGVIMNKFSTAFPNADGTYGSQPADSEIVVFLIGFRNNHPLGLLAPGVKDIGDYFQSMVKNLDSHAEDFGFLGATSWLNASTRTTQNETLTVCYFQTVEGLHKFAHAEEHMKGWMWWNRHVKQWPHMSIYHETYHVPKGNWETIHVNSHVSGLPSARVRTEDGLWACPMVDARRGLLKTSAGRMARSQAGEHDGLAERDPYE